MTFENWYQKKINEILNFWRKNLEKEKRARADNHPASSKKEI